MKGMKIGIDARLYRSSTAGIGRYSQNLIKHLLKIDHQNQYVLFMTKADIKEFDQQGSLRKAKIVEVNIPHYSLAEQTRLSKIIEGENCDLVHFLNFNYPVRYPGKFVLTIHDLTLLFYPEAARRTNFAKQWAFRYILKKGCQSATRIIAVSQNTKADVIKTFKIDDHKIIVIPEAADDKSFGKIDKKKFNHLKTKYKIDHPVILYVGQFRQHKNIRGLLEAFKILRKKLPATLVLVGKVPEGFIDKKMPLKDTLMPGFVKDEELKAWYKIARVFVFPSFYEGFGLPGLEAMMAGTPVVAANRSSLPEIFQDAALYFDPLKPEEIADRIKIVLTNKEKRNWLISQGKLVAKKYSWAKTARETLKIYQATQEILEE